MRWLVCASLLLACNKLPDPPSASAFAAMTDEQKCDATAPRAMRCIDELMVADIHQLSGDSEVASQFRDDYAKGGGVTSDEARAIHHYNCLGDRDGAYQKAVFACWGTSDCEAFARCVYPTAARGR